tara:strand:+ start:1258 stop:1449 length:192 start_codon:yes stop_codon:yes gene_type:complete
MKKTNTLRRLKNGNLILNGIEHQPYPIGELPGKFGFWYDEQKEIEGIGSWYKDNKAGLIYIEK